MKKGDIVIISVVIIAIIISCFFVLTGNTGTKVIISKNNDILYEVDLNDNKVIDLESNLIKIANGKVYMESANCHNQICVKHKPISKENETIVCLPNKVLIEIK